MGNKWIYRNDEKKQVRYILGENGKNPLICIGVNPSTAKPNDLDRTLSKIKKFSDESNKYDGWIMLNVYPLRETKPDRLPISKDESIHKLNIKEIKNIITMYPDSDILCAWGTPIKKRNYLKECLKDIIETIGNKNLKMIALTQEGHPRHPLYCRAPFHLQSFNIKNYKWLIMEPVKSA